MSRLKKRKQVNTNRVPHVYTTYEEGLAAVTEQLSHCKYRTSRTFHVGNDVYCARRTSYEHNNINVKKGGSRG